MAGIVSLDEMRAHLNMRESNPANDAELERMIEAADGAIGAVLGMVVAPRTVTERHIMPPSGIVCLASVPVIEVVALTSLDGATEYEPADVDLDGRAGILRVGSSGITGDFLVTMVAGMADPPAKYVLAEKITTAHLWNTQRVPISNRRAIGGAGGDAGGMEFAPGWAVPRAASELLDAAMPLMP